MERIFSNVCDAVTDYNAGKAVAIFERISSNACNAVRDFNTGKGRAISERIFSNACDAVTDYNAGKAVAISEHFISNTCDAVTDYYACKIRTIIECMITDTCDTVNNITVCYTLGNYHTTGVLVVIFTTRTSLVSHRNLFCSKVGDFVVDTVDLKVVGTSDNAAHQQQRREQIS